MQQMGKNILKKREHTKWEQHNNPNEIRLSIMVRKRQSGNELTLKKSRNLD